MKHSVYTLTNLFREPQVAKQHLVSTLNEDKTLSQQQQFYLHFCLLPWHQTKDAKKYVHTGKFKVLNIVSSPHTLE